MANIFIACPMRSRQVDWGFARSVWRTASERYEVDVCPGIGTLLPTNCNRMLCSALNARKYDWFAMLHDDIEPPPFWVDILIDEAERYGADVVSAVVPIKDDSGATSTAIAKPDSDYGHACRLTV